LDAAERLAVPELVCRALLARGRARFVRGLYGAALGDFRSGHATARQAGDRRHEMRALRELGGHAPVALGAPVAESEAFLRNGLVIATSLGDRGAEADFLGRLAVLHSNRLRFTDAVRLGLRAVEAGRAARADQALALGLDGLKNAYAFLGEVGSLTEVIDELEPLVRRSGDLHQLQWTVFESAVPAIAAARWVDAERRIREAVDISQRGGLIGQEPWFIAHLGWLARLQGHLDVAAEHGRAAVELMRRVPPAWFGPAAEALLAATLLERGDSPGAVALLHEAIRHAGPGGAEAYRLRCLAPLAEATGDPAVLAEAAELLASIDAPDGSAFLLGSDAYLCVARSWLACGEPAEARAVLAPLLTAAWRLRWIPVLVTAGSVDARAAAALDDPAAAALADRVATLAQRHGMAGVLQRG
jgi:tetratricopeptide (TPR) repeat protein